MTVEDMEEIEKILSSGQDPLEMQMLKSSKSWTYAWEY